ncbi:hypothetical protein ACQJBY_036412 [Aegilops geniculata]
MVLFTDGLLGLVMRRVKVVRIMETRADYQVVRIMETGPDYLCVWFEIHWGETRILEWWLMRRAQIQWLAAQVLLPKSTLTDHDRQNSGKATVLGDVARVLRDLITQVESLRKEQSTLLTERQYVGSEKTELQDENTTLRAQIIELQNELRARIGNISLNLSSLAVSHPIGSSCTSNLATHPTPHVTWSNASNLSTMRMVPPTNTPSPLQNQQHHSVASGQVASRPQELQLFPGTSA